MFHPVDQLIPHRPPMQWINALTACTETTATATACFQSGDFAVANGVVLESALVECIAQTVAAALGQRAMLAGGKSETANGMLVAVSNFKIHMRPAVGITLQIEIREQRRLGPMLMIVGTITQNGELVATGDLSLYA